MAELTFLGSGNFLARGGRYWNSFVLDRRILVEPSPIAEPHLHRAGIPAAGLDAVVISHFHADHTFGWPFLMLDLVQNHGDRPLTVLGPPGVRDYLREMGRVANVPDVAAAAEKLLEFVEVNGSRQTIAGVAVRGVRVEHVAYLDCFGYLFDLGATTLGYSGDTRPCDGLEELAREADVLVLECNNKHLPDGMHSHMDTDAVRDLHARHPDTRLILTHMGDDVTAADVPATVTLPDDFTTLQI